VAVADELAIILTRAISEGLTAPGLGTAGGLGTTAGGLGGLGTAGGLGQAGLGGQLGLGGQQLGLGGQQAGLGVGGTTRTGKASSLRFFSNKKDGPQGLQAGFLDDIKITSDARTNSLIIAAPDKTMQLIVALIKELDVIPTARAEISIFNLKRADAVQTALTLQQLFLGSGGLGRTGTTGPGGVPAVGAGGGLGGALGVQGGAGALLGQPRPLQITLEGTTVAGAPIIDLRLSVDDRTNSLIVAGSRHDLDIIEAVIAKLDDYRDPVYAYKLRNAIASDVANSLNDFLGKSFNVFRARDIVIVPEPISNTLLISATTKEYFDEIMRLVEQLDNLPPQVIVQVLVAEVDLNNSDEFGVELGFQSPVFFQRSVIPGGGTVTVNNTLPQSAVPGFNFNNVLLPAGSNTIAGESIVGFQGLGNLGVGRASPTSNIGGLVFTAASDTVNILVRALRTQGRIDVLSRPQIMTLDNQTASINIGQSVPYLGSVTLTATGATQQDVPRQPVGVNLTVTPKIHPDGTVLMRVNPIVSSVGQLIPLGNGQSSLIFNEQKMETTVAAQDGETIVIGGLITKKDTKNENKIPILGDVPVLGSLFRYRTQTSAKVELLIILTPHIVRSPADAERVLAEEARRMDWVTGEILRTHGPYGMDAIIPGQYPGCLNGAPGSVLGTMGVEKAPQPSVVPPAPPVPMSPAMSQQTSPAPATTAARPGSRPAERPVLPNQRN
jgi:type II secretory pathway component GspD/PulD (secretin)